MSWRVENTCAERKFGSATRKQIIMFLADKAFDDGSGIWCSKGTIQRHTELGETTVKRTVQDFLNKGILVETGSRGCKNGFTVIYRIDLAQIEALELTAEPQIETGPPRPPNHPKTIHKPPSHECVALEDEEAEKILVAYPPDRLRGQAECLWWIRAAPLDEGVSSEDLAQAVKAYATGSAGFTRSKVCFPDNWFKSGRWRAYVEDIARSREETKAKEAEMLAGLANWVTDKHPLCRHITPGQVDALLAAELVTRDQIQAAGLRS